MTLQVYTARVSCRDPDALDITRKSAGPDGLPFAPSWGILGPALRQRREEGDAAVWRWYPEAYAAEMRASWRDNAGAWRSLLGRERVVLLCYCRTRERCHRGLLAALLERCGARDMGELPR